MMATKANSKTVDNDSGEFWAGVTPQLLETARDRAEELIGRYNDVRSCAPHYLYLAITALERNPADTFESASSQWKELYERSLKYCGVKRKALKVINFTTAAKFPAVQGLGRQFTSAHDLVHQASHMMVHWMGFRPMADPVGWLDLPKMIAEQKAEIEGYNYLSLDDLLPLLNREWAVADEWIRQRKPAQTKNTGKRKPRPKPNTYATILEIQKGLNNDQIMDKLGVSVAKSVDNIAQVRSRLKKNYWAIES